MTLEDAAKIAGELAVIGGIVVGSVKLMYSNLKLHLKEEFATKEDFKRFEKRAEYLLTRRHSNTQTHYVREDRENG